MVPVATPSPVVFHITSARPNDETHVYLLHLELHAIVISDTSCLTLKKKLMSRPIDGRTEAGLAETLISLLCLITRAREPTLNCRCSNSFSRAMVLTISSPNWTPSIIQK